VGIGNGAATTFDGRAAIALNLDPALARCAYADIHPLGAGGIGQGFVRLDLPSRLVVTQVGSSTILLQAWAPSRAELDTWLPKATEFLDHVHFTDGSSP
jgi:hypothetical protein